MTQLLLKQWHIPAGLLALSIFLGSGFFFFQKMETQPTLGAKKEIAGHVTQFKGRVYSASYEETRKLKDGDPIFAGEQVSTGQHGRLTMKMNDEATISLGEKTQLEIKDYNYSDDTKDGSAVLSFSKGFFRVVTGKLGKLKDRPFKVHTPAATLGVRGTDYWARVGDEGELDMICIQPTCVVATKQNE